MKVLVSSAAPDLARGAILPAAIVGRVMAATAAASAPIVIAAAIVRAAVAAVLVMAVAMAAAVMGVTAVIATAAGVISEAFLIPFKGAFQVIGIPVGKTDGQEAAPYP